ncbi:unnamed protein product [Phyllotreta striolata]|uniref:Transforming acidic coiled-coil-containing protein C-terminal domain-containing protein n=1 Tax=Phyllotreta striolata TaxID=444603 RepID=A0A9N9TW28_PHYSR|nr:unnamed protein product [Phyllotreta striolata]
MDILEIFRMQEPVLEPFLMKSEEANPSVSKFLYKNKIFDQSLLEIFRTQEPVSKGLLTKKDEIDQFKEVLQEKEVVIKNNVAKIKELEQEVSELKETNQSLECQLKSGGPLDKNDYRDIMQNYDDFIKKAAKEREQLVDKNSVLENYIQNLELSYNGLLERYEKAKEIIFNLKYNQDLLKEELEEYREIVEKWEQKYDDLKAHSKTAIADANVELGAREKVNVEEVAKLKSKILQRQAKINELEKKLKNDARPSIYAPLRNKISHHK